jgi:hypothetical protein
VGHLQDFQEKFKTDWKNLSRTITWSRVFPKSGGNAGFAQVHRHTTVTYSITSF